MRDYSAAWDFFKKYIEPHIDDRTVDSLSTAFGNRADMLGQALGGQGVERVGDAGLGVFREMFHTAVPQEKLSGSFADNLRKTVADRMLQINEGLLLGNSRPPVNSHWEWPSVTEQDLLSFRHTADNKRSELETLLRRHLDPQEFLRLSGEAPHSDFSGMWRMGETASDVVDSGEYWDASRLYDDPLDIIRDLLSVKQTPEGPKESLTNLMMWAGENSPTYKDKMAGRNSKRMAHQDPYAIEIDDDDLLPFSNYNISID